MSLWDLIDLSSNIQHLRKMVPTMWNFRAQKKAWFLWGCLILRRWEYCGNKATWGFPQMGYPHGWMVYNGKSY